MGEIRLFHKVYGQVFRLEDNPFSLETPLHKLMVQHLSEYLGVQFLKSKFPIGSYEIDTIGIDDKCRPVIIEYKAGVNRGVLDQSAGYLSALLENKAEFKLLVNEAKHTCARKINWSPRLIIIAGDFDPRQIAAAGRIPDDIELVRYRRFGENHILLEWVQGEGSPSSAPVAVTDMALAIPEQTEPISTTVPTQALERQDFSKYKVWDRTNPEVKQLFQELLVFAQTLGKMRPDAYETQISFRRMKEMDVRHKWPPVFATVRLNVNQGVRVWVLKRTQSTPPPDDLVTVSASYWILNIDTRDDLERAKPLLRDSYERY
ncbi:MAG: hypothetical protein OXP68_04625 [Anaerolineaceae bacterium]|nr:hypothetical protein [Anaerolineaceae bacterium]MDE0327782.1 hypothetical protein [Anaerolineaceae bacterium]